MSAKDIFDKAMTLNEGEQMLVPCHDSRQQESMRVGLAYQRRYFLEQTTASFDIVISKLTRNGKPCILLSKKPRIDTALVISSDGSVRPISLKPDAVSNVVDEARELDRIRASMREDGYSEEAIENYLNGGELPSKDDVCLPKLEDNNGQ